MRTAKSPDARLPVLPYEIIYEIVTLRVKANNELASSDASTDTKRLSDVSEDFFTRVMAVLVEEEERLKNLMTELCDRHAACEKRALGHDVVSGQKFQSQYLICSRCASKNVSPKYSIANSASYSGF